MKTLNQKIFNIVQHFSMVIIIGCSIGLQAQPRQLVIGKVTESDLQEAVPFANIALFDSTGMNLVAGAISDMDGLFVVTGDAAGCHSLRVSAVGYTTLNLPVEIVEKAAVDLGELFLTSTEISLEGVEVVGERMKATAGTDKTTFNINKKMQEASNTGADVLKLIPGVQVDLKQNVYLEGSSEILILVNGRERDRSYLSQLPAGQIDQIEVITSPSSKYDAGATGVINIVLSNEQDAGFDGRVYLEIPTSKSEIYLFPAYSLNYGFKKLNFFTSYNGELAYLDIHQKLDRKIFLEDGVEEIISTSYLRQKNWSHRFHYGVDYFLNKKNQLNFYAFYNPYSWEHDGLVELQTFGKDERYWSAQKEDADINHSSFYSLYYKHMINGAAGHEISADASFYQLKTKNTTTYTNNETGYYQENSLSPRLDMISVKLDYILPVNAKMKLDAGMQYKNRMMTDQQPEKFRWNEENLAAYGVLGYHSADFELQAGMRIENSSTELSDGGHKTTQAFLPNLAANYKFNSSRNIRFNYRKSLAWPGLHQINPFEAVDDPFSVRYGNPQLNPEYRHNLSIEYSRRFENSFVAARLFYTKTANALSDLTHVNAEKIFETYITNAGDLHRYGVQFTGALTLSKLLSFNPYLRVFEVNACPNSTARQLGVIGGKSLALESGFSVLGNFSRGITASVHFQYATPVSEMQIAYFSGALYFISVEKALAKGFKVGITSAVPFSRTVTYHGSEIDTSNFHSRSEGNVQMSVAPFWFKLSYQFSSGNERTKIERATEQIENTPRRGF